MTFSVLTKVTSAEYNAQKFYLYKHDSDGKSLTTLTQLEAKELEAILKTHPNVFSETVIVPRSKDEIKLLEDFWDANGRPLDFEFPMVQTECPNILDQLQASNISDIVVGIDRDETVRQTFQNK